MRKKIHVRARTLNAIITILSASAVSAAVYLFLPIAAGWDESFRIKPANIQDIVFAFTFAVHIAWVLFLAAGWGKPGNLALKAPAGMFSFSFLMFLFSYLYAYNAGLEYIQRFAQTSDILNFTPDTASGKLYAFLMYFPFAAADIAALFILKRRKGIPSGFSRLFLTALSILLYSLSFPSLLHESGFPPLAFVSLVPLVILIHRSDILQGIFWGTVFGVFQTTIINFWLSTFSLVSLQTVIAIYLVHYAFYMSATVISYKAPVKLKWLVFPFAWVTLEYFRSKGFAAYPWCPLGSSQYTFTPFIQIASVTGVYGISFIIALINSALAHALIKYPEPAALRRKKALYSPLLPLVPVAFAGAVFASAVVWGNSQIKKLDAQEPLKTVTIALIQQNTDPRKTEYRQNFEVLKELTHKALSERDGKIDLVAWSETAYVPNIRRWGSTPPEHHYLASLTHEFLDWHREGGFFLLTGNDDYELAGNEKNEIERKSYNAAVFLSDRGERAETYRKIRLVPFTEYFPYEKQFPRLYRLLLEMDVSLWEPGTEQTVFHHPEFTFSTPICFEDIFPDFTRGFVNNGAEIILNISNDYWSLTESEGLQHFISGMFRAVENRVPLVRATASGLTGVVERTGKIRDTLPFYKPLYINTEIQLHEKGGGTIYSEYGDWFSLVSVSIVSLVILKAFASAVLVFRKRKKLPPIR